MLSVGRVEHADEDHDLAALWQSFFDQFAGLTSCRDVVRSDITGAITVRRIAVLRDDERWLGGAIQHRRLVLRVNRADGDAVNAFCEQVIDDALLFRGGTVSRNPEFDFDVGNVLRGFLSAFARDGPEVGSIVGHESEFVLCSGAASARYWCRKAQAGSLQAGT